MGRRFESGRKLQDSGLVPEFSYTLTNLHSNLVEKTEKLEKLEKSMDKLKERFGSDVISFASVRSCDLGLDAIGRKENDDED